MHASSGAAYPGSIQGEFTVDHNGNAIYSVSLRVPPGTAGLAPSLSLAYHSAISNGMMGVGWSLQGLSAILRTRKNPTQDGVPVKEPVHYDTRDRLVLDGLRLVAVDGAYGAASSVYHTEIQTWRKVTAEGDGYVSLSGAGTRHAYGTTPDAQIRIGGPGSPVRVWALSRVTDSCGNFMTYSYQGDPLTSAYYPKRIDYTGNQGLAPLRSVEFVYEARPDVQPRFEHGIAVNETQRLKQIQTRLEGKLVLTYTLEYQAGLASGRSQLRQITLSDADGKSLPPTRFEWLDIQNPMFEAGKPLTAPEVNGGAEIIPLDVDGTGRRDLVAASSNARGQLTLTLLISKGDGAFAAPVKQTIENLEYSPGCLLPLDVDGDGATELVHVGQRDHKLQLTLLRASQSGGAWQFQVESRGAAGPANLRSGGRIVPLDADGDGRIDLAYCWTDDQSKLRVQLLLSTGSGFVAADATSTELSMGPGNQLLAVDFNGDGLTDLLFAYAVTREGKRYLALRVFVSNGRQLELQDLNPLPASANLPYGGALIPARLKDDDQDDLIYGYSDDQQKLSLYTLFGTGIGYQLTSDAPLRTGVKFTGYMMPMAMRGAGLTELAVAGNDDNGKLDLRMLRWGGKGFGSPENCIQPEDRGRTAGRLTFPADVAGHGKTDLLNISNDARGNLELRLLPAPRVVPDRIRAIKDGLNGSYEIRYLPLTDPAVYSKDDLSTKGLLDGRSIVNARIGGSAWPLQNTGNLSAGTSGVAYSLPTRQFAEYVVASYAVSDGRGSRYQYDCSYRGCRIDPRGRGWLGFSSRETRDSVGTLRTEHLSQTFPSIGAVIESKMARSSDNALFNRDKYFYAASSAKGVYRSDLTRITTERFTAGKANPDFAETETRRYDAFGNVTLASFEPSAGLPRYVSAQFDNSESNWRLGDLVSHATWADAAGTRVLSKEEFTVDSRTRRNSSSRVWDDQNTCWIETKRSFDTFGNEVSVTDPAGGVTSIEYDAKFRSFPVRTTMPATGTSISVATSEFDARFGEKTATVDAHGLRREVTLDGLGRPIRTSGPDPQNRLVSLTESHWGVDANGYFAEERKRIEWGQDIWHWSRVYYDALGREFRRTAQAADGQGEIIVERVVHRNGNSLRESLPRLNGEATHWIDYSYDVLGRLIRSVEPADNGSRTTDISYPHVNREAVAESGTAPGSDVRTSEREFASFGGKRCLVKATDACNAVTAYEYDALGRVTKATDPCNVVTTSRYDSVNRRITMVVNDATKTFASETVAHDDRKRTTVVTTHKGNVIKLENDARQRLQKRTVNPPKESSTTTLYEYDRDRLMKVIMSEGITYAYRYDAQGNIAGQTVNVPGRPDVYKIDRTYSPSGSLAQLTYPDGSTLHNTYTSAGQLALVALAESGVRTELAKYSRFTARGRATDIVYGNGLSEMHTYSALGQLKSQLLKRDGTAPLEHTEFQWNAFHSLDRIEDRAHSERTQAFSYDLAGRLTSSIRNASGPTSERVSRTFRYDTGGNLKSKNDTEYAYQGHQVLSGKKNGTTVFSAAYGEDGEMQRVEREGKPDAYQYDGLGRLIAAANAKFVYNHAGQRVVKESKDATTYYISPEFEVTVFKTGAIQTTKYAPGFSGPIAQITRRVSDPLLHAPQLAGVPAPGISYFHTNLINSTAVHTDHAGAVLATVEYEPFGEIYSLTGSDVFRAKFTGKELDHETGLYYFNARYYDPSLGRFLSADDRPGGGLDRPDSLNRYAYVLNNPITGIDFDGHFRWDIFADVMIGIAAVTLMVAATVVTGGAALAISLAGSTLLGAAVSGSFYSATAGDNFEWKNWGIQVGIGAATGLISAVPTGGAVALGNAAYTRVIGGAFNEAMMAFGSQAGQAVGVSLARQAAARAAQLSVTAVGGAIGGALAGITGNTLRNWASGDALDANWDSALIQGAYKGAVTGLAGGMAQAWAKPWFQDLVINRGWSAQSIVDTGKVAFLATGVVGGMSGLVSWANDTESSRSSGSGRRPPSPLRFTDVGFAGA